MGAILTIPLVYAYSYIDGSANTLKLIMVILIIICQILTPETQ